MLKNGLDYQGGITIVLIVVEALATFIVDWMYLKNTPANFFDVTIGTGIY